MSDTTESSTPADDQAEASTDEPQFANRAERRAAKGKGKAKQHSFGNPKVSNRTSNEQAQRIWSNRKAGG
ncbi:hypothetical protein [Nocardia jejuensis]|uniref:hypothetical protein n=1 Tax=Nocardia jejuensis TaxID=328049 RepID=UPI00083352BA|nr:hypothetical protein [Nocardia jejuensis]